MAIDLDDVDVAILRALRDDARASIADVARGVAISRSSAYARVRRMTDAGVILGYSVRTDPIAEGMRTSAYVALTVEQAHWQDIRAGLLALDEVEHVALVGGDFDVLVLVRARDNRDLRRIVLERMQALPGVRSSRTFLVFEDVDARGGARATVDGG